MKQAQPERQFKSNFWYGFFSQGFYFSVGYFTFAKIAYCLRLEELWLQMEQ